MNGKIITDKMANNISYIFIPFRYKEKKNTKTLLTALELDCQWQRTDDKTQYMLKYVADKIEAKEYGKSRCDHFVLTDHAMEIHGLAGAENTFYTEKHLFNGSETEFSFEIRSAQIYHFSTSVSILLFQLYFKGETDESVVLSSREMLRISSAQYYLKKVSREHVHQYGEKGIKDITFLGLAQKMMEGLTLEGELDFFFYANEGTERANLLTYLEADFSENFEYELFYLRRCYKEDYLYYTDEKQNEREIYTASKNIIWGLSSEAAVCIVCPGRGGEEFLRTRFFKNFNKQYLFMYVLLLHQKYVLYLFQTMIDAELYEDLEILEEYRKKLYKFETDFVYSRVTEVPQYQNLYDRMTDAFALRDMYEDVREPLLSLSEVRRGELEKQQKKREDKMNSALFVLSLLGAFSALSDIRQVVDSFFGEFLDETMIEIIQGGCAVIIILIMIYVFSLLIKKK